MTINEALGLVKMNLIRTSSGKESGRAVFLVCGFEPLHLTTFLKARQSEWQPGYRAEVLTGIYGDIVGNLARAADSEASSAAVVVEWADIDGRLGLRGSAGWGAAVQEDILLSFPESLRRIAEGIRKLASRMPVAVLGPTLPLPPLDSTISAQVGLLELELRYQASSFLRDLTRIPGARIVRPPRTASPSDSSGGCEWAGLLDAKMELLAGFPYSVSHADAVARCLAQVLWPKPPAKGLITDLDGTLWAGIVGEIGAADVSWSLEHHSQPHALYQQMLGRLADSGVLLAIVSKNNPTVVKEALARTDLLVTSDAFFPVLATWGAKSQSVAEVLRVWNIGADSVVFVDDSQMELDEVRRAFPEMTCLLHPGNDATGVWRLLGNLRDLFGKPVLTEEDRLRRDTIRAGAILRELGDAATSTEFLQDLQGTVTLDYVRKSQRDTRALELVNKTNQFNLNGLRIAEGDWQRMIEHPHTLSVTASYRDKFGMLGRIGVLVAEFLPDGNSSRLRVNHWVLSCRAFSRRIEYHMLDSVLKQSGAETVEFAFTPTSRNQPINDFLTQIGVSESGTLESSRFHAVCSPLPHAVEEILT